MEEGFIGLRKVHIIVFGGISSSGIGGWEIVESVGTITVLPIFSQTKLVLKMVQKVLGKEVGVMRC